GGRAARAIHEPGSEAWRAPCGRVHAGPLDETGDPRTTLKGMPWALMVLSWVLHQGPRRRGKSSPVICRVTGCMVGCGWGFAARSSNRPLSSPLVGLGSGLEESRLDAR